MTALGKRIVFALIAFVLLLSLGIWSLFPANAPVSFDEQMRINQQARYAAQCEARGGTFESPWCIMEDQR